MRKRLAGAYTLIRDRRGALEGWTATSCKCYIPHPMKFLLSEGGTSDLHHEDVP